MAKVKPRKRTADQIAKDLSDVRLDMALIKELDAKLTTEFKEALHEEGATEAGNYQLSTARTLKVTNSALAFKWAEGKNCLKIDVSAAREALRHEFTDPAAYGFTVVETERVVPKRGLEDNEE